jgi:hypothetical protein
MQSFQDTGSKEDYIIFGENFKIKKSGGEEFKYPRKITVFGEGKKAQILLK